jgi:ATP-binding cassette subfamily B protein
MNNLLSQNLWSFIWHFLKPYKHIVLIYIGIALLAGCWGPFNSMLIKYMVNYLSSSQIGDVSGLTWPAVFLVLNFIVFDNFTWRSIGYLNYKFQPVVKNQILSESFRFVLGSSHQFFNDNLSGRISSQISTLADNIERILHQISADFLRGFSLLIIALVSMYYVNPMFFYILALWFVAFSSFSIAMSKQLVNLSDIHTESESAIAGQLVDSITNVSNIRIFARRPFEVDRLEEALTVTKEKFQKKELFLVILHSVQGALIAIMLGFMAYFLIHLYGKHLVSVGDFVLILGLGMDVAHMTWYTMSRVDDFNQAVGKCKQSLRCLIVPQEIQDKKDAASLLITKGQITFSDVKFHYHGTEPLFQNKSITIEPGQKIGLVGYSGGGKSTFVNLILRLYDITDGHILIDDQDIRNVTQDSLRKHIAMIPQDGLGLKIVR